MATPGFIPYTTNIVGYPSSEQSKMSSSRPAGPASSTTTTGAGGGQGRSGDPADPALSDSTTTRELDSLYERLSNASLALKNLDPTIPAPKDASSTAQPSQTKASNGGSLPKAKPYALPTAAVDSGASSPKEGGADADKCDADCACQRVLLEASPGSCGICGGRPAILSKQNQERLRALDDLEIATQRINELAHEKARHVDYIADLETRVSEQARKIDQQRDIIAGLKNDLSAMNDKFVDQVNMTAEIAHSRELVEAELEDLTQKLFTEANTMVAAEKKARFDAEKTAAHLRNIIGDLEVRLSSETMQSQELKERIEQMSAEYDDLVLKRTLVPSRRGSISSHLSDAAEVSSLRREGSSVLNAQGVAGAAGSSSNAALNVHGDGFRLGMHAASVIAGTKSASGLAASSLPIRLDEALFVEFKDFALQTQSNRLANYMSMPFMKNVVAEDVESCLRFGPRPRISVRNVLESISSNRLQVEEMTQQVAAEMRRQQQVAERANSHRQAILWERFSGTVAYNPRGCQACGREGQCSYRFRMGTKADSEWIQIDNACRDRLVAVCEFYGFVRYLRQGIFASRPVIDLYMETIRLRLCMFYARIGAYGYAVELDSNLAEATLLVRTPSIPPQPESPGALNGTPSFGPQLSPTAAPYIHAQRAASAISVPWRENVPTSPSHLAADTADAVNRNRSRSQEAPPTMLSPQPDPSDSAPLQQKAAKSLSLSSEVDGDTSSSIGSSIHGSPDVAKDDEAAELPAVLDNAQHPGASASAGATGNEDSSDRPLSTAEKEQRSPAMRDPEYHHGIATATSTATADSQSHTP
ncbi:hypothetical protein LPJ56_001374 [Coemansia sp. RSA 2599]|nr:hypothetical protein LPJ56_001374 [Coemansia sp. RSA 2599]